MSNIVIVTQFTKSTVQVNMANIFKVTTYEYISSIERTLLYSIVLCVLNTDELEKFKDILLPGKENIKRHWLIISIAGVCATLVAM